MLRKTINVMFADFDNTLAGHAQCHTAAHRLNPMLIEAAKNYDELVIVTKRRCLNLKDNYHKYLLMYVVPADLLRSKESSPITVFDSENKEHPGELAYLKSGLITSAVETFTALTGLKFIGVSMPQDITAEDSDGFGYTYRQHVKPLETAVLVSLSTSNQISLPQEKAINEIRDENYWSKNSQIRQGIDALRKLHGDDVHLNIGFFEDHLTLCRNAHFEFDNTDHLTFTAYHVTPTQVIKMADVIAQEERREELERQRLEEEAAKKPAAPVFFANSRNQNRVAVQYTINNTSTNLSTALDCDGLHSVYKFIKDVHLQNHGGRFFRPQIRLWLTGELGGVRVDHTLNSMLEFENLLITQYAFSPVDNKLSCEDQLLRWQQQLPRARMSDTKRSFLQQTLELLIVSHGVNKNSLLKFKLLLDVAVQAGDDAFFTLARHSFVHGKFSDQINKTTQATINKITSAQANARQQMYSLAIASLSVLTLTSTYAEPTIGLTLATLILASHCLKLLPTQSLCNNALERYETRARLL